MNTAPVPFIGPYQIIKSIAKGGMGEVFLAYDTTCKRKIALKRIRSDLEQHPQIHRRFLKEVFITCQLTHPGIIPIYMIHQEANSIYYTMPFVEGETLKHILRRTKIQEKKGESLDHLGGSIPALIRVFVTICQATSYAHSKGILHRDLKPENVIIGKYGEVLILDWGLAKITGNSDTEELPEGSINEGQSSHDITKTGKVVGTISYIAPEIALGHPATVQTDIYALGTILYQLLTLTNPFRRGKTIAELKKTIAKEEFIDPCLVSPYRDIPRILSRIAEKCLSHNLSERYQSVNELIHDLEIYLEGRSEWFLLTQLNVENKEDWEFQENILLADQMAITQISNEAAWVSLMISRSSFLGNTKLEVDICLGDNSSGIGFLISAPEASDRLHINEGYCLWIGSEKNKSTKLLRSNVEVLNATECFLKPHLWYRLRIEKIEQTLHIYINDLPQFSYIAHLPLVGTHIGLLSRDADFETSPISISVGSLNITQSCLAVPDSFLAHRYYSEALNEYRRIAYSFPDRLEGRDALFRAGLTILEQAKKKPEQIELFDLALEEFEKLHDTPGAPLEYLGKALVYQSLGDYKEEIKCFELASRRYSKHPLLHILQEQIIVRMHEISRNQRLVAYHFILLSVRHLPLSTTDIHTRRLFNNLNQNWETLPFVEVLPFKEREVAHLHIGVQLAFWLAKPFSLYELIEDLLKNQPKSGVEIKNALFCLIELGCWSYIERITPLLKEKLASSLPTTLKWIQNNLRLHKLELNELSQELFNSPKSTIDFQELRSLIYWMDQALDQNQPWFIYSGLEHLDHCELSFEQQLQVNIRLIWAYLLDRNWKCAENILYAYPLEMINIESSLLYFLYGCWLQGTEETDVSTVHFSGILPTSYPRSCTLAAHYIANILNPSWSERAFLWEKRQLYRQLTLYYHCSGDPSKKEQFQNLYQQQFIDVDS